MLGWYHSKAEKKDKTRGEVAGKNARLPPLKEVGYLFELVLEVGVGVSAWAEIQAWSEATGTPVTPWEANAIKRYNLVYANARAQYEGKNVAPPWMHRKADQAEIAAAVKRALRGR